MISKFLKNIQWMQSKKFIFKEIIRGVERETLRITLSGKQSLTNHPKSMGSSLTHKWITTDFSENLLEFVTPKTTNINYLLSFLKDIYRYTCKNLKKERMWPLSMPYFYKPDTPIKIATYGKSYIGKIKTTYRKGLKNRYGIYMNIISGVHYNFSFPSSFWVQWKNIKNVDVGKNVVSNGYLGLIRNYYRFGWIISYFFGASPAISSYMIKNTCKYHLKNIPNHKNCQYLPWATSLRTSSIGYNNSINKILNIKYNSLSNYINKIKFAMNTPMQKFVNIGIQDNQGNLKQLNTNMLQTENEFYTQIRPKRKTKKIESSMDALTNKGIEYVEVRSLDINPFTSIGINKKQILFLDLFLIWCTLFESPHITNSELQSIHNNWELVAVKGRKPNLNILINNKKKLLVDVMKLIFDDLFKIAEYIDKESQSNLNESLCIEMEKVLNDSDLTYSAKILDMIHSKGMKEIGLHLSDKYFKKHCNEPFNCLTKSMFIQESTYSYKLQKKIESNS